MKGLGSFTFTEGFRKIQGFGIGLRGFGGTYTGPCMTIGIGAPSTVQGIFLDSDCSSFRVRSAFEPRVAVHVHSVRLQKRDDSNLELTGSTPHLASSCRVEDLRGCRREVAGVESNT